MFYVVCVLFSTLSLCFCAYSCLFFFFFNDTATTEIYTLSLHDALPISAPHQPSEQPRRIDRPPGCRDRKSTRLNSSHDQISYAVFCLKKKQQQKKQHMKKKKMKSEQQREKTKTKK